MHILDVIRVESSSINIVEKFYGLIFFLRLIMHLILPFLSIIHVHLKLEDSVMTFIYLNVKNPW